MVVEFVGDIVVFVFVEDIVDIVMKDRDKLGMFP
jgi:hypothetical protein